MSSHLLHGWPLACVLLLLGGIARADEKEEAVRSGVAKESAHDGVFARPATGNASGTRFVLASGTVQVPVVVVRGTPYEMGRQLGQLMQKEVQEFVPPTLTAVAQKLKVSQDVLQEVWARSAAFADDRVEQELAGLADGSGVPLRTLQAIHAVPLLMPYSCSSIAAWGDATADGHLYQTRNLDWSLEIGAHEFPVVVVYLPQDGIPHVVPSFAGVIGAHTGMNAGGIVLAEMGDAAAEEMPYQVHAPHFTVFNRTLLYDADSLTRTLDIFLAQPLTKRYHFVFGDGRNERRAVKIRAHAPEPPDRRVMVWKDNDPTDEFAPNVLSCVVYNDEGRGAFPTLKQEYGKLNGEKLIDLANRIPIKGGNVVNAVYDATDLRLWISYAQGDKEAYQRPYVFLDLKTLDTDRDGAPDFN
ncbi:MAG: C45 family autoproteolytic acyltransferase/hydrolase [Planctomycetes bacterium]|nr:C45 family autoproteolytic acyltransferase/hydrolase [Planctomycetota bacterium]